MADDVHRFVEKNVLLTGDAESLSKPNGAWCIEASLLLLHRICPRVTVVVPPECVDLRDHLRALAEHVAFGAPIMFADEAKAEKFDAALSVGATPGDDVFTFIDSNGWSARVASSANSIGAPGGQGNVIGALFAASLGVSEVFKRLLAVREARGAQIRRLAFSLYTYGASDDPGPPLPAMAMPTTLLVGAGAIGNGVAYALGRLPLSGSLVLVDGQTYGEENLGTCLLLGPTDIGKSKAFVLARQATHALRTTAYAQTLQEYTHRLGLEQPYPKIVLSAVDSARARHAIQDLWPDVIINGATGDFPWEVSRHTWGDDVGCMRCTYSEPVERAELALSREVGLPEERLSDLTRVVDESDVACASDATRVVWRDNVGKQLCSVINDVRAKNLTDQALPPRFAPSVPFVATMAAAAMVGELVKHVCGWPSVLAPRLQSDALIGPTSALPFPENRRPSCLCVTRAQNIDRVRRERSKINDVTCLPS